VAPSSDWWQPEIFSWVLTGLSARSPQLLVEGTWSGSSAKRRMPWDRQGQGQPAGLALPFSSVVSRLGAATGPHQRPTDQTGLVPCGQGWGFEHVGSLFQVGDQRVQYFAGAFVVAGPAAQVAARSVQVQARGAVSRAQGDNRNPSCLPYGDPVVFGAVGVE
jgi:hypothetical protein